MFEAGEALIQELLVSMRGRGWWWPFLNWEMEERVQFWNIAIVVFLGAVVSRLRKS